MLTDSPTHSFVAGVIVAPKAGSKPQRSRPQPKGVGGTGRVTRETYTTCRGRADVVLYKVAGGSHSWPGGNGGDATQEVSATELIWEFFTHYRR